MKKLQEFTKYLKEDVIDMNGTKLFRNVTKQQFDNLFTTASNWDGEKDVRVFIDKKGLVYAFDASHSTHSSALNALGIQWGGPETISHKGWHVIDAALTITQFEDKKGPIYAIRYDQHSAGVKKEFEKALKNPKFHRLFVGKRVYYKHDKNISPFIVENFLNEELIQYSGRYISIKVYRNISPQQFNGMKNIRIMKNLEDNLWYGWDADEGIHSDVMRFHANAPLADYETVRQGKWNYTFEINKTPKGYLIDSDYDVYKNRIDPKTTFDSLIKTDPKFKRLFLGKSVLFNYNNKAQIVEEVMANTVGSGAIKGMGTDLGVPKNKKPKLLKRKKIVESEEEQYFKGHKIFQVDPEFYAKCTHGKRRFAQYKDYVGQDKTGLEIRMYGIKNPGKPIIVQNNQTGGMMYLRYGKYDKDQK